MEEYGGFNANISMEAPNQAYQQPMLDLNCANSSLRKYFPNHNLSEHFWLDVFHNPEFILSILDNSSHLYNETENNPFQNPENTSYTTEEVDIEWGHMGQVMEGGERLYPWEEHVMLTAMEVVRKCIHET